MATVAVTCTAETSGTLISISAKGAPGTHPLTPTQVAAVFTRAVDKATGRRWPPRTSVLV